MRRRRYVLVLIAFVLLFAFCSISGAEDSIIIRVNGTPIQTDIPPQIENGRVMVPLRVVAESFGYDVNWTPDTKTVTVSNYKPPVEPGIIGPDDFVEITQKTLNLAKEKDPEAYNWIISGIKAIVCAPGEQGAWWACNSSTRVCFVKESLIRDTIKPSENYPFYLGILIHEATHTHLYDGKFRDVDGKQDIITDDDTEMICDLVAIRALQKIGAGDNLFVQIKMEWIKQFYCTTLS